MNLHDQTDHVLLQQSDPERKCNELNLNSVTTLPTVECTVVAESVLPCRHEFSHSNTLDTYRI